MKEYTTNQPIGGTCDENAKVVKGHCGDSPDDCPVCSVLTPHPKLLDAKEMMRKMEI